MFLLAMIPGVLQVVNTSRLANQLYVVPLFSIAVISIPSMAIIFFGMAVFCAFIDRSPISGKALWFVLFFATGPFGSVVYYFVVYRRFVKRKRADDTSDPRVVGV